MDNERRKFLKQTALTGLSVAGSGFLNSFAPDLNNFIPHNSSSVENKKLDSEALSVIGLYGAWAASLNENKLPSFSFRREEFTTLEEWRKQARKRVKERMAIPNIGGVPKANIVKQYTYDGLDIEELTWQLPYGRATEAILLKPENAKGKLRNYLAE